MLLLQPLKMNSKLDITRAHDILDFEVTKFHGETNLFNDARVLATSQVRVLR
jgi:hypothetical protein